MSSFVSVDTESDGPIPHVYSLVCFGAVIVTNGLSKTFYGKVKPISSKWIPEALAISGFTREEHETFDDPKVVMQRFAQWLKDNVNGQPVLISDNPVFDWQWINYYFHYYLGYNPFGHSARRIGDLYCGMKMNTKLNREWKKLRMIKHDHNPVNDAKGNANALLKMGEMGLKL